jgi:hypothetical protein
MPHPDLLVLSKETGHPLTDAWCMKLAAGHIARVIETAEDLEKTLITLSMADLRQAVGAMQPA